MRTSAAGLELIKSFEGFRETATRLPDGRWTIGYGHVRTAREGLTISPKDAEDLLVYDLKPVEDAIASMIFAPVMQSQFDALVSLAFNISPGQFRDSDVLRNLNAGDYLACANGFDLWRKARIHGRVMIVDALVRRRAAEKALFLEHPSGRPSAPTPIVTPQMDFGAEQGREAEPVGQPRPRATEDEEAPRAGPAPSGDIAEAVRRLAQRTQEAVTPAPEIPLPPGAGIVSPETSMRSIVEPQPATSAEDIEYASRTMAERVARILVRTEQELGRQEVAGQSVAPAESKPAPQVRAAETGVLEGLPDFDRPAEALRKRPVIDDTEVIDPGVDPAKLFAEGERKAKVVNGNARRIGPLSGRLAHQAPWIIVLVLSVLGVIIGAVDTFKTPAALDASVPRAAATVLAVFGVMMVMSVYFIFWNRTSDEA